MKHGNASSYTLARLRRDRPELAERVERAELSANKAAIEAGFRTPTFTVPLDLGDPMKFVVMTAKISGHDLKVLAMPL